MRNYQVVVVGGGPAGSSCAQKLVEAGRSCLVMDKDNFPRPKTCAGWLTPAVFRNLGISPDDYPLDLTVFENLRISVKGFRFRWPGTQYAIRRLEFDSWMLERAGADFLQHEVKRIARTADGFVLDGAIQAEYLVGAGGTHCPVYHTFWGDTHPRQGTRIVALECEFRADWQDPACRLWFLERGFPGYAWYVPKTGRYVNIGLGGAANALKERGLSIQQGWEQLVARLISRGSLKSHPPQPSGYVYYLNDRRDQLENCQAFLVGDAAGLATLDMGEGIGPAIRSGQLAAEAILSGTPYTTASIARYSLLPPGLRWLVRSM